MPNVGSLITPERILRDVRSMIPDPLKSASNEDQVQVAWHKFRVHGGPRNELFANVPRYGVQLSVLELERSRKLAIAVCKSSHAVTKNRHRQTDKLAPARQLPGLPVYCLGVWLFVR